MPNHSQFHPTPCLSAVSHWHGPSSSSSPSSIYQDATITSLPFSFSFTLSTTLYLPPSGSLSLSLSLSLSRSLSLSLSLSLSQSPYPASRDLLRGGHPCRADLAGRAHKAMWTKSPSHLTPRPVTAQWTVGSQKLNMALFTNDGRVFASLSPISHGLSLNLALSLPPSLPLSLPPSNPPRSPQPLPLSLHSGTHGGDFPGDHTKTLRSHEQLASSPSD
jgi:hypothetical protein